MPIPAIMATATNDGKLNLRSARRARLTLSDGRLCLPRNCRHHPIELDAAIYGVPSLVHRSMTHVIQHVLTRCGPTTAKAEPCSAGVDQRSSGEKR